MTRLLDLANVLPAVPVLLAHLAGIVVAVVLLIRREEPIIAPVLALIGFGLLVVLDGANLVRGPLIRLLSHRTEAGVRLIVASVSCCCSLINVAAIVCLIVAIWRSFSGEIRARSG